MNLQGTGKFKNTMLFFNKQEVYTTVFVIEVKFGNFQWVTRKLFDECRQFLLTAQPYKEDEFQVAFPREIDIADDVFILVERKESMEKFLEGVVATMDFLIYKPLYYFLNSNDELRPLIKKIERIQAVIRMFLIQRKMNQILLVKYQADIQKLMKLLKTGIRVTVLSTETQNFEPVKKVLWILPNSSEPGLSRLCCTTCADFFAYSGSQDEDGDEKKRRKSVPYNIHDLEIDSDSDDDMWGGKFDGLYLSDIAEVRKGPSSFRFGEYIRNLSNPSTPPPEKTTTLTDRTDSPDEEEPNLEDLVDAKTELVAADCAVVVGSERDFEIQFLPESFQGLFDVSAEDEDDEEMLRHYARDWFVDTLSLLAIQSLGSEECSLRNRSWTKFLSEEMKPEHRQALVRKRLGTKRVMEAAIFRDVMVGSIQVDEEICDRQNILRRSPSQFNIETKVMWYDQGTRRIYIQSIDDGEDELGGEPLPVRGVDLDDIAEIRPGRISFSCDGSDLLPSLTIVGTETSLSLPLDSVAIRNALLRQFQSFLTVYRNPDRSAYFPSQIPATPLSNSLPTDDPKLSIEVDSSQSPSIGMPTSSPLNINNHPVWTTPSTILSSSSLMKPTRRKSTPASLNKSYTHSNDSLFVHVPVNESNEGINSSPVKQLAGSVPKDFFSPTRHSATAKLKSQSMSSPMSPLTMTPMDSTASPSLKKLFSSDLDMRDNEQEGEEEEEAIGYQSGEKSDLAMTLQFDE